MRAFENLVLNRKDFLLTSPVDRSSSSSCLEGSNQRGNGDCGTDPREFAYYKYTKHKTKQKQSEQNV